jgi:adenylate cyclase
MFVPGFAGPDHALKAIQAGVKILELTGHDGTDGPWIPLGVGVHTGEAFVGSLGSEEGAVDITVLGDVANTAARLSSRAGVGEMLISERAYRHAGYSAADELEQRELLLKGKKDKILVNVLSGEHATIYSG